LLVVQVLLQMYTKYKDKWIVQLLFDDLLDWSNWFLKHRVLPPAGLISLGGDGMQGARFESGLDNSPMYDGNFWNSTTRQMEMYDVGMCSMFTMEAEALSKLADAISRPEGPMLKQRAASMRALIAANLWDAEGGIYTNQFPNGSFYRRISPTSFYPMLASAATTDQAKTMMTRWMMNASHFCITPKADFNGNTQDCWWGLPSIEASDPAFPHLGYWRGYVWGPMSQLTYWSLSDPKYADVVEVTTARKAMSSQLTDMMMNQWHRNRHICENYNPHHDAGDCSGDNFYHWGGLTGLTSLIEAGYY
jgi:hypothetical protein